MNPNITRRLVLIPPVAKRLEILLNLLILHLELVMIFSRHICRNKNIHFIDEVSTRKIVKEIKESKYYTIIAYKAADSCHKEQLSPVLHFVDSEMNIRELICFLQCRWG